MGIIEKAEATSAEVERQAREYASGYHLYGFSDGHKHMVRELMVTAYMAGVNHGMEILPKPTFWQMLFGGTP